MTRVYSLGHLTAIDLSPPRLVDVAHKAGFEMVGLRLREVTPGDAFPIVGNPALIKETQRALAETGLSVLDVELVKLEPNTDPDSFRPMFECAAQLGARHVLAQGHDADRNRLADNHAKLCGVTAEFGLTFDIEFLTWAPLHNLAEALAVIDASGQSNAGLIIDSLHFFRSGCDPSELRAVDPARLRSVQLSDASGPTPASEDDLIFTARYNRLNPGEGTLPLTAFLENLPADTPIALEVPNRARAALVGDEERASAALSAALALVGRVDGANI